MCSSRSLEASEALEWGRSLVMSNRKRCIAENSSRRKSIRILGKVIQK